jgi:nitrogen fixation NifU-like protein
MKKKINGLAQVLQQPVLNPDREKYSKTVIGHAMNPRNLSPMNNPDGHAVIKGPCGDTMELFIRIRDGKIADASFLTSGCITSIASGSMAVEIAIGKSVAEAWAISQDDILNRLGGLPKENEHCALLAANTLREAVMDYLCVEKKR